MAPDFGQAGERLGSDRINIVGVIIGGGGENLQRFVLPVVGERQCGNGIRRPPGTGIVHDIGFAIAGEGKLTGVQVVMAMTFGLNYPSPNILKMASSKVSMSVSISSGPANGPA
jgi:hypothetical protein